MIGGSNNFAIKHAGAMDRIDVFLLFFISVVLDGPSHGQTWYFEISSADYEDNATWNHTENQQHSLNGYFVEAQQGNFSAL